LWSDLELPPIRSSDPKLTGFGIWVTNACIAFIGYNTASCQQKIEIKKLLRTTTQSIVRVLCVCDGACVFEGAWLSVCVVNSSFKDDAASQRTDGFGAARERGICDKNFTQEQPKKRLTLELRTWTCGTNFKTAKELTGFGTANVELVARTLLKNGQRNDWL
jgi:hypothetical protein